MVRALVKSIRVYVHSTEKGKRSRKRHNFPSHYSLGRCLELAGYKQQDTSKVKGCGFEEGSFAVHVQV